jgi:hypothetical protein
MLEQLEAEVVADAVWRRDSFPVNEVSTRINSSTLL